MLHRTRRELRRVRHTSGQVVCGPCPQQTATGMTSGNSYITGWDSAPGGGCVDINEFERYSDFCMDTQFASSCVNWLGGYQPFRRR